MFADKQVQKVLDLDYILEKIHPITPYGRQYKASMRAYPPGTEKYLREDLDLLETYVAWIENKRQVRFSKEALHGVKDIRYSIKRARGQSVLSEVELFEIKTIVFTVKNLQALRQEWGFKDHYKTRLKRIESLEEALNPKGESPNSFYIYDSYSDRLKDLRRKRTDLENKLRMEVRQKRKALKEETGLSLSADRTVVISKQDKGGIAAAEGSQILSFSSETFSTVVYALKQTDQMLEETNQVERYKACEAAEETKIRAQLSEKVAKERKSLLDNISALANIDLLTAKAEFTRQIQGVKPEIIDEHKIQIKNGRYPKIENQLKKQDLSFTPISVSLDEGVTCITGANMGGKTISLKIVGLLSLMAQMGLFVPAEAMTYGLNQFIRTSIGDFQSTDSGLSTFGGEIRNVSRALNEVDKEGLVLIDELARGTNPQEGYAISYAIAKYLLGKKTITMITTHFDEITRLEGVKHLQVVGLANVDLEDIDQAGGDPLKQINQCMDYRLKEVSQFEQVPKDAIRVARLMGLPKRITAYAEEAIREKEKGE
ncbi:MAG: DNA mismatch repair protein MutS [Tissierellia bacterium]|nr:DNA mismatch repair protein MutS [Tissierellia bacterium]